MSRSSASRRAASRILFASILAVAVPMVAHAATSRTAPADSGRHIAGIRVSDDGIEIRENGRVLRSALPDSETAPGSSSRQRFHISVDNPGVIHIGGGPTVTVDGDDSGIVRVFADAYVPADRDVDGDVVAVFGSARIDGRVSGTVVAVFGSVSLGPGATVMGDAVAVGGPLDFAPGASVNGESVSLGLLPFSLGVPTLPVMLLLILAMLVISLLFGWILFAAMPRRMMRTALTVTRRTGSSVVLGLLAPPLVIVTIGLLLITVIGIPGALLLPLLYGMVLWAGQVAAAYVLGCKLLRRVPGAAGVILPLLVGTVFVAMFFLVGAMLAIYPGALRSAALFLSMVGLLLFAGLATVGSGAFLVSRLGTRPDDLVPPDASQTFGASGGAAGTAAATS